MTLGQVIIGVWLGGLLNSLTLFLVLKLIRWNSNRQLMEDQEELVDAIVARISSSDRFRSTFGE